MRKRGLCAPDQELSSPPLTTAVAQASIPFRYGQVRLDPDGIAIAPVHAIGHRITTGEL